MGCMLINAVWNFGGALERDVVRMRSASFLVYLLFVGFLILVSQ